MDLADERLAEADLLFRHNHFTGAAYIAGYAVELLLKSIIATKHLAGQWPVRNIPQEIKTHDFEDLLRSAQLEPKMRAASRMNPELGINWIVARTWSPSLRYTRLRKAEAGDIVGSIKDVPNGIAPWLKVYADV